MVRLSKPGQQAQYVSYLDRIDDENVLKGLETLRRRAIHVTGKNPSKIPSKREPPGNPKDITESEIVVPMTPKSMYSAKRSSSASPATPKMGPRTMMKMWQLSPGETGSAQSTASFSSSDTPAPVSPPIIQDIMAETNNRTEFVPKWKLCPRVEPPEIPRWQLETLAQERAVAVENHKKDKVAGYQEKNGMLPKSTLRMDGMQCMAATEEKPVEKPKRSTEFGKDWFSIFELLPPSPCPSNHMKQEEPGQSAVTPESKAIVSPKSAEEKQFLPFDFGLGLFIPSPPRSDPLSKEEMKYPVMTPKAEGTAQMQKSERREVCTCPGFRFLWRRARVRPNISPEDKSFPNVQRTNCAPDWNLAACPRNLALEPKISANSVRKESDDSMQKGKMILNSACCDNDLTIENFVQKSESVSGFFNRVGCFGAFDRIIEPADQSFDENFTYCSHSFQTEKEESISESYTTRGSLLLQETSSDNMESNGKARRGLGELEPMLSTLEEYKRFLEQGISDPIQLEYVSSLLYNMEGKLEIYSGYRRRDDWDWPKQKTTLEKVTQQFEEVNKLMLRVIEDFIDEQLLRAINQDENSLPMETWSYDEGYTMDGTILGGDVASIVEDENDSRDHRPSRRDSDAFDVDFLPSAKESQGTSKDDLGSLTSTQLATGKIKFLSADYFNENNMDTPGWESKKTIVHEWANSPNTSHSRRSEEDEKSVPSSKSNSSRTTFAKNLSKVLSRPTKQKDTQNSQTGIETSTEGVPRLDKALFVSSDNGKYGTKLPPLKPGPMVRGPSHCFGVTNTATWRRGMQRRNSRDSMLVLLQETHADKNGVAGIESVVDSPRSGTALVNTNEEESVIMVQETFDQDNKLSAVESIVGIAAAPIK